MKSYSIEKTDDIEYKYIIMSTSHFNPFDERKEIEQILMQNNYKGKILFDLLLKNGLAYNRYIEVFFDGKHFDISSIQPIELVESSIKTFSSQFYKKHSYMLEGSILPKPQQFLIKKGIVI